MVSRKQRRFADLPPGRDNPLDYAVNKRDQNVLGIVKDALQHDQALLAYQPIVLAKEPTKVAFYEGLVRVLDATGRVIPARDFMPQIETTELGRQVDVQALSLGLRALRRAPDLRLSINMSARSIGYRRWLKTFWRHVKKDNTLGERLILEISEKSAMLVPELVVDFMDELQPHGVCFALDNYGSGNAAIRYFKDFFFDILKIDGEFIRGVSQTPDNKAITAALVSVANQFDMLTIAESVESAEDAALLTEMGLDCLQGYYFGAPTVHPPWQQRQQDNQTG